MKKVIVIVRLLILCLFILGFNEYNIITNTIGTTKERTETISSVPTENQSHQKKFQIPFIGNNFIGFKEALAFKESQGNYQAVK